MVDTNLKIAILAAHGGSDSNTLPLGGGAAICERLLQAWGNVEGLQLLLIVPGYYHQKSKTHTLISQSTVSQHSYSAEEQSGVLNDIITTIQIPLLKEGETPCNLSEFRYANFCRQFEKACTDKILELKPDVVMTHDISEGPNFQLLNEHHIPCIPIFHVDVVDFFCRMYLHEYWTTQQCVSVWSKIRNLPFIPNILRLVFDKQANAVKFCPKMIVPSQDMKQILINTYGSAEELEKKIEVVPWGAPTPSFTPSEVADGIAHINSEFNLNPEDPVIVMLSRISPEKAQHKLLEALLWGEQMGKIPAHLTVFICGTASFMRGASFMKKLQNLSKELTKTRVIFPGHVGNLRKAAILARATVFVTTSKHESYGLTTMEAMQQGTPAVAIETPGAKQTIKKHTGIIVPRQHYNAQMLWETIHGVLVNPGYRRILSDHAKLWAQQENFIKAAQRLLDIFEDTAIDYAKTK
ncbi:MAG: glycosyltransferase family 4 protein [Candidatus Bruticola sp.]